MKHFTLLILIGFSVSAHAAVEVGDNLEPIAESRSVYGADSGMSLRSSRRAGVGVNAAGAYGIMGMNLELNLTPRWSTIVGFGLSTEFQTFNFQARRVLGGEALLPYLGFGLAHWSNNGEKSGGISKTNPSYVAEQFMDDEDRELGRISETLIYPALGLQYLILEGNWTGVGVNLELDLLLEVSTLEAVPTGSLGVSYYF